MFRLGTPIVVIYSGKNKNIRRGSLGFVSYRASSRFVYDECSTLYLQAIFYKYGYEQKYRIERHGFLVPAETNNELNLKRARKIVKELDKKALLVAPCTKAEDVNSYCLQQYIAWSKSLLDANRSLLLQTKHNIERGRTLRKLLTGRLGLLLYLTSHNFAKCSNKLRGISNKERAVLTRCLRILEAHVVKRSPPVVLNTFDGLFFTETTGQLEKYKTDLLKEGEKVYARHR